MRATARRFLFLFGDVGICRWDAGCAAPIGGERWPQRQYGVPTVSHPHVGAAEAIIISLFREDCVVMDAPSSDKKALSGFGTRERAGKAAALRQRGRRRMA